jgi:hypothetical protein
MVGPKAAVRQTTTIARRVGHRLTARSMKDWMFPMMSGMLVRKKDGYLCQPQSIRAEASYLSLLETT